MSPFRLAAACFSTATLLFASQIAASADPANRFYSHWQRSDAVALLVVVLAAALVAYLLARAVLARGGPGAPPRQPGLIGGVLAHAARGVGGGLRGMR